MNCSSDAYMGRIHRWAPLDEKPGLVRWHWGLGDSAPWGLPSMMGAHRAAYGDYQSSGPGKGRQKCESWVSTLFKTGLSEKFREHPYPSLEDSWVARGT